MPSASSGGAGKSTVKNVRQLLDDFLLCRDMGHAWGKPEWREELGRMVRNLECERCSTVRVDRLRYDGTLYRRNYDYADDYLVKGAKDRQVGINVQTIRAELIRRVRKG